MGILIALLLSIPARAQTYPSPHFNAVTVDSAVTFTGSAASGTRVNLGAAPTDSPVFTTKVTLPSWTSAPSTAAGVVGYNTSTGRYDFGVGGSVVNHVRLSGDTMLGALNLASGSTAPTQTAGDNSTKIATTAFAGSAVGAAIINLPGGFKAGRYYSSIGALALATFTGARLYATPIYIPNASAALQKLAFVVTTGNSSSAWNAHVGLYTDNGLGAPGSLVANTDTALAVALNATGTFTATLATPPTLTRGWYWVAFLADTAGAQLEVLSGGTASLAGQAMLGTSGPGSFSAPGVFAPQTYGALPATFPANLIADAVNMPIVWLGF